MLETSKPLTNEPEELESKFVTLPDGVEIHYKEAGPADAPAVLLAHGFLGSLKDWRYTVAPLAALALATDTPRRIIAFDWVGFGRSSKPAVTYSLFYFAEFLKNFADALGFSRMALVGNSMGGKHNLAFAILYPSYVEKLVLVDTDGFLDDPWWTTHTNRPYFKPLANFSTVLLGQERFLRAFQKNVFFDTKFYPDEAIVRQMAQELRDPQYKAALRALNRDYSQLSLTLTGLRSRLKELQVPVQLFWGQQDRILPIEQGHRANAEISGSQMHIFDGCGHLPQIEKATEFNQRLLDFLNKAD